MESRKGRKAVNKNMSRLRFGVWLLVSAASLAMAWANCAGFIWSGAWLKNPAVVAAAAYLPMFFALGWLLVPVKKPSLVALLLASSGAALAVCLFAILWPDVYPLKVTLMDFAVLAALPLCAYVYRRLHG